MSDLDGGTSGGTGVGSIDGGNAFGSSGDIYDGGGAFSTNQPTVTPFITMDPCPRVDVDCTPEDDAVTIWIWRNYDGISETIRGGSGDPVSGETIVTDYDAPFGVPITYTFQTAAADGTLSVVSAPSDPVTLDVAFAVGSDPLDPANSMAWPLSRTPAVNDVRMKLGSLSGYSLAANQSTNPVVGASLPTGQTDVRQGPSSLPITLEATTKASWEAIRDLLNGALIMCVRLPGQVPLIGSSVGYYMFGSPSPAVDPNLQRVLWSLSGTAVQGPSVGVIVPTRTLDDVGGDADTLDGLGLIYDTLVDIGRGL